MCCKNILLLCRLPQCRQTFVVTLCRQTFKHIIYFMMRSSFLYRLFWNAIRKYKTVDRILRFWSILKLVGVSLLIQAQIYPVPSIILYYPATPTGTSSFLQQSEIISLSYLNSGLLVLTYSHLIKLIINWMIISFVVNYVYTYIRWLCDSFFKPCKWKIHPVLWNIIEVLEWVVFLYYNI